MCRAFSLLSTKSSSRFNRNFYLSAPLVPYFFSASRTTTTATTNSYMMIKGKPCKVLSISVSKTGKHGHAKCNFTATDIFTGKKLEDMIPSSHGTTIPIVDRTEWDIMDIGEDGEVTLMDEGGNEKTDINLPTYPPEMAKEIRAAWDGGENQVSCTVQSAVGIEQIVAFKKA